MAQTIIVVIIIAVTLFFMVRYIVRSVRGKRGCGCGCSKCQNCNKDISKT